MVYYESETAVSLMIKKVPFVNSDKTVKDVEKNLMNNKYENIEYIYVGEKDVLAGVLSIKELFRQDKNKKVKDLMKKKVHSVNPNTDQEEVVKIAMKYNLKAVPVVENKKLLGVVPHHVILDILHKEGIEDLLHKAGVHPFEEPAHEIIHASTKTHFKKRLPWLLLGLLGGTLAALIVGIFEEILSVYVILAAFIPAVVYMADAIANQAQTIFIRSMALEDIKYKWYLLREFKINIFLALILAVIFYLVVLIGWNDSFFALVIGTSIFATTIFSVLIAVTLPVIFKKFNSDPAFSTGPFSTALVDLSSLIIYFGIAQLMITYL